MSLGVSIMGRAGLFAVTVVMTLLGYPKLVYCTDNMSALNDVKEPLDFDRPVPFPQPQLDWIIYPVAGRPNNFAVLPNSIRLRKDLEKTPEYRVIWNSLHVATEINPPAVISVVVEPAFPEGLETAISYLRTIDPDAKLGIVSPSKVRVEGIFAEFFGSVQQVREIPGARANPLTHAFVIDFTLTRSGARSLLGSASENVAPIARLFFSFAGQAEGSAGVTEREFQVGSILEFNCRLWPNNYFDVLSRRKGCVDADLFLAQRSSLEACMKARRPPEDNSEDAFLGSRLAAIDCAETLVKLGE
jgi:hypothetical protein